jgi:hypothetical protein
VVPKGRGLHVVEDRCANRHLRRVHGTFSQDSDQAHVLTVQDAAAGALFAMRSGIALFGLSMACEFKHFNFTRPHHSVLYRFEDMDTLSMDGSAFVLLLNRSLQQFQITRIFVFFRHTSTAL